MNLKLKLSFLKKLTAEIPLSSYFALIEKKFFGYL